MAHGPMRCSLSYVGVRSGMSDDAPRSTQGNRPDQRRGRGAPAWWDLLQRSDLPDDPSSGEHIVESPGWKVRAGLPGTGTRGRRRLRLPSTLVLAVTALVILAASVLAWAATAGTGHSSAGVAVIVAVPGALLVATLLGSLAGRRRHR